LLDEFEVTVGRMRKFVEAYPGRPRLHDGKAPHIQADEGWLDEYPLPETADELRAMLACPGTTWTDAKQGQEELPATCVDWYVAYAFCIWDGGRLPTEAEWNAAAAGGSEQRVYPWSDPPGITTITESYAAYGLTGPLPPPVGSKPLGNARWGHADLAGSVYEWTLDHFAEPYESTRCIDCLATTGMVVNGMTYRSMRGGGFRDSANYLYVSGRLAQNETLPRYYLGFRCVRDVVSEPLIGETTP
jgi:formylglycine-generating enzyme required for sulfatase activity